MSAQASRERLEATAQAFFQASALLDPARMMLWDREGLTVTQLRLLGHVYENEGIGNADLAERLNRHVAAFAAQCAFDLGGRRLKLDSLWVNVLKPGGAHSGHIHPHSVVSGTVYVTVPNGAWALKLEDPRLPMLMAAPPRRADAPEQLQTFVYAEPKPGAVFLWESWLRHEVVAGAGRAERISISFNYRL